MATANELLRDEVVRHQVDILRYSNHVVRRIIALLNRVDADLFAQLALAIEKAGSGATVQRLELQLLAVRKLNAQAYDAANQDLQEQLRGLSEAEAAYQLQLFDVVPVTLDVVTPTAGQAYAAALARPFQGRLLAEWAASIAADRMARIRDAVRMGIVENQATAQIVQRIRGTRARNYADGLIEIDRRHAEAVVRTAVQHVAGVARDQVLDGNADLLKGVVWVSTLDSRTSELCRIRDGLKYTTDTHKPIGHKVPWGAGPGRLHWCCRSSSAPILKSWRELGIDMEGAPAGARASMDGEVPAETTFAEWIQRQPVSRQDEILGPARGALLRSGGLKLTDFYNEKGRYLTLEELRARNADAFRRAGLDLPIRPPRGTPQDEIARFLDSTPAQQQLMRDLYAREGDDYDASVAHVARVKADHGYRSSLESLTAIRYYTGNGYAPINQRMRESGGTLEDRQFTALTARGIRGMPAAEQEIWRAPTRRAVNAEKWWEKAVEGQPLDMGNQLQSFSASPGFAASWAGNSDVLLKIAKPGVGAYIEPLSQLSGEHEVLLPPGLTYRVVSKSETVVAGRRFRVIELEVDKGG